MTISRRWRSLKGTAAVRARGGLRERIAAAAAPGVLLSIRVRADGSVEFPYVSPACADLAGLSAGRAMRDAAAALDRVHPEDRRALCASLAAAAAADTWRHEFRLLHPVTGERELAIAARRGGSGDEVVWHGIVTDVTRRSSAPELGDAPARTLALAVEQGPASVILTDLDGRIQYVNAAFSRNMGYAPEEVVGRRAGTFKSGLTPRSTFDALWAALRRGDAWEGEFVNRRRDGSLEVDRARIAPIRQRDGRVTHYVAVQEDITERKREEQELARRREHLEELVDERTRQLLAANHAKDLYLANMSHEIRTPMNAIVGLTHLLRRRVESPAQRELLEKISVAANHLLGILNDVLDMSKIEAGKLTMERMEFSLHEVLHKVHDLILDRADAKQLRMEFELDPRLPGVVRGDPLRLGQVLLNLASNAVKFTDAGTITVRARLEREDSGPTIVRFEVEDTGVGIPEAEQARLFDAFEQAEASTARRFGGTGLGLSICRRLVGLMGGEIGLSSVPGRGSTFWFTAALDRARGPSRPPPLGGARPGAQPPSDPRAERPSLGTPGDVLLAEQTGTRVLLVEDDPINQEVAQELLRAVGLSVDLAGDGQSAVDMASRAAYAVVLMDLQLPAMGGLEATRRIRALSPHRETPILAMTASVLPEDRTECLAAGMNDVVTKPVDPEELYRQLARWLLPAESRA